MPRVARRDWEVHTLESSAIGVGVRGPWLEAFGRLSVVGVVGGAIPVSVLASTLTDSSAWLGVTAAAAVGLLALVGWANRESAVRLRVSAIGVHVGRFHTSTTDTDHLAPGPDDLHFPFDGLTACYVDRDVLHIADATRSLQIPIAGRDRLRLRQFLAAAAQTHARWFRALQPRSAGDRARLDRLRGVDS